MDANLIVIARELKRIADALEESNNMIKDNFGVKNGK